jgi:hypothetical protein
MAGMRALLAMVYKLIAPPSRLRFYRRTLAIELNMAVSRPRIWRLPEGLAAIGLAFQSPWKKKEVL